MSSCLPTSQAVVTAVDDSFYKITSEALLVLHLIVKIIRPLGRPISHVTPPHPPLPTPLFIN